MRPRRISIALLSAVALGTGAFAPAAPAWSQAQPFAYHDWTNGHLTVKPHCAYKGVMSDAEIELCTGHPVNYDYGIRPRRSAERRSSATSG